MIKNDYQKEFEEKLNEVENVIENQTNESVNIEEVKSLKVMHK